MTYLHLIYIIPAVFSAAVIGANLMPFERSSRHNTLFLFLTAVAVFNTPQQLQLCLAICLPVAYLHKFFGVSISGIEAMDYQIRKIPVAFRALKQKLFPVEVPDVITKAYPKPEDEEEAEPEPPKVPPIRRFVPELP